MLKNLNHSIQYQWKGLNREGQEIHGELEANSLLHAKVALRKEGIITHRIKKKRWNSHSKKINPLEVMLFSRQLSTLIQAGIPLVQSFEIIAKGLSHSCMKALIETVKNELITGSTLSQSLRKFPEQFNELYCNLIEAGEKSGTLDEMLENLANHKEKMESIKRKIKTVLTYPIAVMSIALLVMTGLLMFVVPQFESLFISFGATLPSLTSIIVNLSRFFQHDWFLIIGLCGTAIHAFLYLQKNYPSFQQRIERYLLNTPIIGPIIKKAAIARFSQTLSITFAAGIPLLDALKSVAGATGNILFAQATEKISKQISNGQPLQFAMEQTHLFPNMVLQMIAVGEESGTLESMLNKIADFYESAVDREVEALGSLLEPLIMSILGLLVGGLIVAMYLPIFKLGSVI